MPTNVRFQKNIGEQGMATVKLLKDSVRISFVDGETYDIEKDLWPENLSGGEYNVTLNKGNTKLVGVKPPAGNYFVRFKEMGNRTDDVPMTKLQHGGQRVTKDGRSWYQPDRMVFHAVLEVSRGKYEGTQILVILPYAFAEYRDTGIVEITSKSRRDVTDAEKFLTLLGFNLAVDEIPYSANILPWLEAFLRDKNAEIMCGVSESGWANVKDMSVVPEGI